MPLSSKPTIVSLAEWESARAELLKAEKEATRALDALAAKRRRLPMTKFSNEYTFDSPDGPKTLLDLFGSNNDLAVYQFMDNGPGKCCPGCSYLTRNIPPQGLETLAELGISWAHVSNMPLAQIEQIRAEKGWTMSFVSSHGTTFAKDHGASGGFMLTAFMRDGNQIYRTYSTTQRGTDRLNFVTNIQELTAYGRQQVWEDSPDGWPQYPTYGPRVATGK